MPPGMPGHIEHVELQVEARHLDVVAFAERLGHKGDPVVARPVDRYLPLGQQAGNTTNVVSMVMGE